MRDDMDDLLIDDERNEIPKDSFYYENEMNEFMLFHEGEQIVNDIQLLRDMGYENKMINKVYILLHPETLERAIDFMTEIDGVMQHDFFENNDKSKDRNLCFICGKGRRFHLDHIPEEFLENNNLDFNFNDNNLNNNINNNDVDINININNDLGHRKEVFMCNICYEDMLEEEKEYNSLPCKHFCCSQCWINYLKTQITEAKVEKIKCIEHKCNEILPEEFILKHIEHDPKTVEKYRKFKRRAEIINDPNKKQCPQPDCDSFLEKPKSKNKYVECERGHNFCFECLRPPHGKQTCEEILEKDFQLWSKGKVIKKCPKCKIYTEKNEGCNHMTCTSCKYQWCWLCEGEYKYGHYAQGQCNGHQFTKANYISEVPKYPQKSNNNDVYDPFNVNYYLIYNRNNNLNNNRNNNNNAYRPNYTDNNRIFYNRNRNNGFQPLPQRQPQPQQPRLELKRRKRNYFKDDEEQTNCCCSISTLFYTCFHKINYIEEDIDGKERIRAIVMWLFGYFLFFSFQIYNTYTDFEFNHQITQKYYKYIGYATAVLFYFCYQISFFILITPFIIVCMFYPFFIYKLKMFFTIGKANYVPKENDEQQGK